MSPGDTCSSQHFDLLSPGPRGSLLGALGPNSGGGRRHRSNSELGVSERQILQEAGFQGMALPELGGGVLTRPWRGSVGREVLLKERVDSALRGTPSFVLSCPQLGHFTNSPQTTGR